MKPHIYFQRYPSGRGYWRVSRTPVRWVRLTDCEKFNIHAAHTFVNRLNGYIQ